MKLIWPEPPADVQKALKAGVPGFLMPNDPLAPLAAAINPAAGPTTQKVFWADAGVVGSTEPLTEVALPAGWRFLARDGKNMVAAYVSVDLDGPRVTSVSFGSKLRRYFDATSELVAVAAGLPEGDVTVRVLNIPCLLTEVFWCTADASGQEWVVPISSLTPELSGSLTSQQFQASAGEEARRRLESDEKLRYGKPLA